MYRFDGGSSKHLLDWEEVQTLCGVAYKPGLGGDCKSHGKYLKLSFISRMTLQR